MSTLAERIAAAADAPAFFDKESKIGDHVTLRITSVSERQTIDPASKKRQTWESGDPKMQLVITGTNIDFGVEGQPEKETYTVYIKLWGRSIKALSAAAHEAGIEEPTTGDLLTVTFVGLGDKPANKALSQEKLFEYTLNRAF